MIDLRSDTLSQPTEEMLLESLDLLAGYQRQGIRFDWYWIDAGWSNPLGDLKDFDPRFFPQGPARTHW